MTDEITPISPSNPPQPVTGEKQGDQEFDTPLEDKQKKFLAGTTLLFFKKIFTTNFFSRKERRKRSSDEIAKACNAFSHLLESLKTNDHESDPHFSQMLSEHWEVIISAPTSTPLDPFIDLVNDYPHGDMHSLGFYLTNHAGDDWLPFPLIEILKKLHQGYILRKGRSELSHMLDLLHSAITYFS